MKDSLKNTFPLDGKKSYGLYWPENAFPLLGMRHSLKNTFPLYGNSAFSGQKKNRKWFSLAGKYFSVKIDSP